MKNFLRMGSRVGRIAVLAITFVFICTCLAAENKDKFVKYRKLQGVRVEVFRIGGNIGNNPVKKEIRQMHQKLDDCYRQLNRNRNITDALIELEELLEKVQPYIPQSAVYYKDEIDMLSLCNESMRSEGNKPDSVALLVQVDTVQEMQVEDTAGQVVQSYIRAFEKAEQLSVQPADTAVPSGLLTEKDSADVEVCTVQQDKESMETVSETSADTVAAEHEDERTGSNVAAAILLIIGGLALAGYYVYSRIEFYNIVYSVLGDDAVRMIKRGYIWQGMPECLRRLQLGKEDDVMEVRRPGEVRRVYYYSPIEGARKNARKKYYREYHFVNDELVTWEIIKKKAL